MTKALATKNTYFEIGKDRVLLDQVLWLNLPTMNANIGLFGYYFWSGQM